MANYIYYNQFFSMGNCYVFITQTDSVYEGALCKFRLPHYPINYFKLTTLLIFSNKSSGLMRVYRFN